MSIKYPQTEQFLICWFSDEFELSDDQTLFEYFEVTDIKELKNLNEELICIEKGSGEEAEWIAMPQTDTLKTTMIVKAGLLACKEKYRLKLISVECKNICVSGILNLLKGNIECQYQTNLSISF